MKTYSPKPQHIERRWYVVDAQGQTLGRMASEVAALLRGKHKPIFAPHMDTGDHVIVINAGGVVLTGDKEMKKVAYRHSGYPGGIKGTSYDGLMRERPEFVVEKAVRGMLPEEPSGPRDDQEAARGARAPSTRTQAQQPVAYTLGQPPKWEGLPTPAVEARARRSRRRSEPTTEPGRGARGPEGDDGRQDRPKKSTAEKTTAEEANRQEATTAKKTTRQEDDREEATTTKKPAAKKPPREDAEKDARRRRRDDRGVSSWPRPQQSSHRTPQGSGGARPAGARGPVSSTSTAARSRSTSPRVSTAWSRRRR